MKSISFRRFQEDLPSVIVASSPMGARFGWLRQSRETPESTRRRWRGAAAVSLLPAVLPSLQSSALSPWSASHTLDWGPACRSACLFHHGDRPFDRSSVYPTAGREIYRSIVRGCHALVHH